MKIKSILVPAIYLLVTACFAQVHETSEERQVADFNSVSASSAVKVVLEKARKPSVKIVSEGIPLDQVITEVTDQELKISISKRKSSRPKRSKVIAYVSYTSLKKIEVSSAATVSGEVIKSSTFEVSASSAAKANITGVETDKLTVSASSASKVEITGKSGKTIIDASSASKVDGLNLLSKSAIISTSSAAKVTLAVEKEMEAKASSGSSVYYKGNPVKNISNTSSGASIKKIGS